MKEPVLSIERLTVHYPTRQGTVYALQNIDLDIYPGKTLVLLGESGCGKSTLGRTLLGILPIPGKIVSGTLSLKLQGKKDITNLTESQWQAIRGAQISMIFQDPVQALNPVMKVGPQIVEAIQAHSTLSTSAASAMAMSMLVQLELPESKRVYSSYPFQLSGGMCQRVAIATALINNAKILIADEPTTALDVRVESVILKLIKSMQEKLDLSLLLITHDIGVAKEMSDYICVMYGGRVIETGKAHQVLNDPRHPYTKALLACAPDGRRTISAAIKGQPPDLTKQYVRCPYFPRCERADDLCYSSPPPPLQPVAGTATDSHKSACLQKNSIRPFRAGPELYKVAPLKSLNPHPPAGSSENSSLLLRVDTIFKNYTTTGIQLGKKRTVQALRGVSLSLRQGEIVGVVGESGCGKTTLAKCILGLESPDSGDVFLYGNKLSSLSGDKRRQLRRKMQPVFQSPRATLNPGRTALKLVQEPLNYFSIGSTTERYKRGEWLLDLVGLSPSIRHRKPHELSTGQCQRIAIARALALEPELLICDEPASSLDLSVQAQILALLTRLHEKLKFGVLFISHNILVVQSISHKTIVMQKGQICETLSLQDSRWGSHPYTRSLLQAIPGQSEEPNSRVNLSDGMCTT